MKKLKAVIDELKARMDDKYNASVDQLCKLIDNSGDPLQFAPFQKTYHTAADIFLRSSKIEVDGDELREIEVREAFLDDRGFGDVQLTEKTIKEMQDAMDFDKLFMKLCKMIDPSGKDPLDTEEFQKYIDSVGLLETTLDVDELPDEVQHKALREPFLNEDGTGDTKALKAFIEDLFETIAADKEHLLEEERRREMQRLKELETRFNLEFDDLVSLIPSDGDILKIKIWGYKQKDALELLLEYAPNVPRPMCSVGELKAEFGVSSTTTLTEETVKKMKEIKEEIRKLIK